VSAARTAGRFALATWAAGALASAPSATAHVVGGTPEVRTVADPAGELSRRDASGRRWVAWRVPGKSFDTVGCFRNWTRNRPVDCGCSLAEEQRSWGSSNDFPAESGELEIYARVESGKVTSLLLASESCPVALDGERLTVLEGVDPNRGVALLETVARTPHGGGLGEDLSQKALAAIAHHSTRAVPAATAAIARISRDANDPDQRSHALFWLSQTDDTSAAKMIREAIARDPDGEVREQGVFALSQLDDATDQLLAVLRESPDQRVKRQALFWLGQSDDPKALAAIEDVLLR